jgi:hypothetical protein
MKKKFVLLMIIFVFIQNVYSQDVSEIPIFRAMDLLIAKYEFVAVEVTRHNWYVENAYFELHPDGNVLYIVVPTNNVPMYLMMLIYYNDRSRFDEYIENVKIFNLRTRSGINGFADELKRYTIDLGWPLDRIVPK